MAKSKLFDGKRVLITGGTGSLANVLVRRLLSEEQGRPEKIILFSRDEAKQHAMRVHYMKKQDATEEILYNNFNRMIQFRVGDVRNIDSIASALGDADLVIHAAALKQVPSCEYFPYEAVQTNIIGAENIVRAIKNFNLKVETVLGVSTDKACKPVNVMGMTKAIQERVLLNANIDCPDTRFICVRYGNVLASRGSVIPLFNDQIRHGGPVTITDDQMTRFLLSLDEAVDIIFNALAHAADGETYIPIAPAAKVTDIAAVLIGDKDIETKVIGVRPGEKVHEILISEEEAHHSIKRGDYYVLKSRLPELRDSSNDNAAKPLEEKVGIDREYSSADDNISRAQLVKLLEQHNLTLETSGDNEYQEMLG